MDSPGQQKMLPGWLDQFRAQYHGRLISLLSEFDTFEYEIRQSEEALELERKRKEECLSELRRKYPRWSLPNVVVAQETGAKHAIDSSPPWHNKVQELTFEIDQLKHRFQNITMELNRVKDGTKVDQEEPQLPVSTVAPQDAGTISQSPAMPAEGRVYAAEEVKSSSSDDNNFFPWSFTSIRPTSASKTINNVSSVNGKKPAAVKPTEEQTNSDSGSNTSYNYGNASPPTRFAFDRTDTIKAAVPEEKADNRLTPLESTHKDVENKSWQDDASSLSSPEVVPSTFVNQGHSVPDSASKKEDDFLAQLFPDKFGRKTDDKQELFGSRKEDSDSDFFS